MWPRQALRVAVRPRLVLSPALLGYAYLARVIVAVTITALVSHDSADSSNRRQARVPGTHAGCTQLDLTCEPRSSQSCFHRSMSPRGYARSPRALLHSMQHTCPQHR